MLAWSRNLRLFYFFGHLDGDGKGTRLHQYFRTIAQESLKWREFNTSGGSAPRPRVTGYAADWAAELTNIVIAGRTDAQLREEIITKFKGIGVKL